MPLDKQNRKMGKKKDINGINQETIKISEFSKMTSYKTSMQKVLKGIQQQPGMYRIKLEKYIQNSNKICKISNKKYTKNWGKLY